MAKFMDVHNGFVGVTEPQLREARERDLAAETVEGVHFEHAWLDPESGTVFCLSSGPSKEAVRRVHDQAGHPTQEIYELAVEVGRPPSVAQPHRAGAAVNWPESEEQPQ
ncbi:MAG: gualylate cyclase [Actinomycetia bacterium]|nr:gualylate cyclase [Actinomycetes bacterium]